MIIITLIMQQIYFLILQPTLVKNVLMKYRMIMNQFNKIYKTLLGVLVVKQNKIITDKMGCGIVILEHMFLNHINQR